MVGASSETCITISLIDDDVIEPDESFTATLKSANAQVASNHYDITNISIFDGDGMHTNTDVYNLCVRSIFRFSKFLMSYNDTIHACTAYTANFFIHTAPDFQVVFVTSSPVVSESPAGGVSVTLELNRVDGNSPFRLERQVSFTLAATGFPISVSGTAFSHNQYVTNYVLLIYSPGRRLRPSYC